MEELFERAEKAKQNLAATAKTTRALLKEAYEIQLRLVLNDLPREMLVTPLRPRMGAWRIFHESQIKSLTPEASNAAAMAAMAAMLKPIQ